jgi:hypothetical protein
MGTVRENRRAWFNQLLGELERSQGRGAKRAFALKIKTAPNMVSQIANNERGIGDTIARRMEAAYNLERGRVDGPFTDAPQQDSRGADLECMGYMIEELETALREADVDLLPKAKRRILLDLYSGYAWTGERPSKAVLLQFAKRAA